MFCLGCCFFVWWWWGGGRGEGKGVGVAYCSLCDYFKMTGPWLRLTETELRLGFHSPALRIMMISMGSVMPIVCKSDISKFGMSDSSS